MRTLLEESSLQVEPFSSSAGGTPLLFDRDGGSRKEIPLLPEQPRFVGTDRSLNPFFGEETPFNLPPPDQNQPGFLY
jgi:hypothetical protein